LDNCRNAINHTAPGLLPFHIRSRLGHHRDFTQQPRVKREDMQWNGRMMARLQRDCFCSARSEGDTPLFDAANTASVTLRCIQLDRSAVAILVFVPECSPRIHRFGGPEGGERNAADG